MSRCCGFVRVAQGRLGEVGGEQGQNRLPDCTIYSPIQTVVQIGADVILDYCLLLLIMNSYCPVK